jgi:hypothetical protein
MIFYFAGVVGQACALKGTSFLGIPHWWKYLGGKWDQVGACSPDFKFPSDTWLIGLAIIDILLFVAGLIAVVMIIIAGINYITSMGNSDKAVAARKKITNALIGLGIILISSATVSFIGKSLGGS